MRLAATEYDRFGAQLKALGGGLDQSDGLPDWDVRALASPRVGDGGDVGVDARADAPDARSSSPGQHLHRRPDRLAGQRAHGYEPRSDRRHIHGGRTPCSAGRRRAPGLIRRRTVPDGTTRRRPWMGAGRSATWSTAWSHTIPGYIGSTSLGRRSRNLELTPGPRRSARGRRVASEWAARHGQPCTLTLTRDSRRILVVGFRRPGVAGRRRGILSHPIGPRRGDGLLGVAVPF